MGTVKLHNNKVTNTGQWKFRTVKMSHQTLLFTTESNQETDGCVGINRKMGGRCGGCRSWVRNRLPHFVPNLLSLI